MYAYVHGNSDSDETNDDPDRVTLLYPLSLSLDLWIAYIRHGVMPQAGGYLDQPRAWRDLIHRFNQRYNAVPKKGETDEDWYRDLSNGQMAQGWDGLMGESQ